MGLWERRGDAQNKLVFVETYYRSLVKNSIDIINYVLLNMCLVPYCMVVCGINRPRRLCIIQYSIIPTGNNYTRDMITYPIVIYIKSHNNFPSIMTINWLMRYRWWFFYKTNLEHISLLSKRLNENLWFSDNVVLLFYIYFCMSKQ